ncbi:hypothetical protein DER45DRAFT_571384 [Fusarium avenaceum]|nr:hypothetical protein DER45DRAFT_571384 [Fusarium avenaceum]
MVARLDSQQHLRHCQRPCPAVLSGFGTCRQYSQPFSSRGGLRDYSLIPPPGPALCPHTTHLLPRALAIHYPPDQIGTILMDTVEDPINTGYCRRSYQHAILALCEGYIKGLCSKCKSSTHTILDNLFLTPNRVTCRLKKWNGIDAKQLVREYLHRVAGEYGAGSQLTGE